MNKKKLIIVKLLVLPLAFAIPSLCIAKPIVLDQSRPAHLLSGEKEWRYESVDSLAINKRLRESAEEYKVKGIVPRMALYDLALPADAEEYANLDKNVILLVTAVTHNKDELPIKSVYIDCFGKKISLEQVLSKTGEVEDGLVKNVLGGYREDAFYLLPMSFLSKTGTLAIDWAKNRDGFVMDTFPKEIKVDYSLTTDKPGKEDLLVKEGALKQILEREYSVEFKEAREKPKDSPGQVDWDKIEYHLYKDSRAQHPDKSEAEIEQVIGYALLQGDNQWERATVHLKKAAELDPKLYFSWYTLGLIYIDTEEGNEYFRKAIEAKPDFPPPYYWLAYTYCRFRRDKEAIPIFEKYVEVAKNSPNESQSGRLELATAVLKDLRSGREGKNLKKLRKPNE